MKRILLSVAAFIILALLFFQCTKTDSTDSNAVKNSRLQGSASAIAATADNTPHLSPTDSTRISDSLQNVLNQGFGINPVTGTSKEQAMDCSNNAATPPVASMKKTQGYQRGACNTPGVYHTGAIKGGVMSGFIGTYHLDGNTVTDFNMSTIGLTIGWSWSTSGTYYTGNLTGITFGTTTFSYANLNFNFTYELDWRVSPGNCMMYYKWKTPLV